MEAPLITIFVRHSKECKYVGDEFCKRCQMQKASALVHER